MGGNYCPRCLKPNAECRCFLDSCKDLKQTALMEKTETFRSSRDEEIFIEADKRYPRRWSGDAENSTNLDCFIEGAEWADEHPKSKYNLSDVDYVRGALESIIQVAERITTGNLAHQINCIKLNVKLALNRFEEIENGRQSTDDSAND